MLLDQEMLKGWKQIARYIGVSVSTAKRYDKKYHIVVRRYPSGNPFAFKSELDTYFIVFQELIEKDKRKRDKRLE